MKPYFQSDAPEPAREDTALIDPEAYDATEQHFAASLEAPADSSRNDCPESEGRPGQDLKAAIVSAAVGMESASAQALVNSDSGAWRQQVAEKLNKYRARRQPREPRYPSLQLKFEPSDPSWEIIPAPADAASHLILDGSAAAAHVADNGWPVDVPPVETPPTNPAVEPTARVIPFRRSATLPPKPLEELAEPLQLFPRILEVPEVAPPPPALGGILIEPAIEEAACKRPGIDLPLQTSPIGRRFLAAATDAVVLAMALGLFGYIFFQITGTIPAFRQLAFTGSLVLGIFWAGYQFLLLTYAGSTPGLKLAGLRLSQFDGAPVAKRTRRWRVLASILSAVSLGLGYAWCLLDEDQLCWHDRITKTHLAPKY